MRVRLCLLVLAVIAQPAQAAVTASVDRNPAMQGEAVELQVTADGASPGEPDFSSLQSDFNILRRSSGTQISTINGQTTRLRTWTLLLAPRRLGTLNVPPITVGSDKSQPIALEVLPPDPQAGQASPAFIEFTADTTQPYVRQQVRLSVKLFIGGQLASGGLSDPAADGAVVEQLGEQREGQAVRGQTRYRVFERDYALFAEAAGPLRITPPSFNGELRSGRSPRALFNFGGLGDTRTVVASGDAITLDVQAPPTNAPAGRWLPASNVTLAQRLLPPDVEPRVGVPLTREIVLTVDGQLHTQIAPIDLPEVATAQVYAEPPTGSTQVTADGNLRGEQSQRWAVIPQTPGRLSLAALELRWWDTRSNMPKTATLPATTLSVLPAPSASAPPATVPVRAADDPAAPDTPASVSTPQPPANTWWPWIAAAATLAWLLTALAWIASRWLHGRPLRALRQQQMQHRHTRKKAVLAACKAGDARATRTQLLAWASLRFSEPGLTRLSALPQLLQQAGASPTLLRESTTAIRALDQAAFGSKTSGNWQAIAALLPQIDALKANKSPAETMDLPPLYPA